MITGWHICKGFTRLHYLQHGTMLCKPKVKQHGPFYSEQLANANSPKQHTRCTTCTEALALTEKQTAKKAKTILINHLNALTHEQL